MGYVIALTVFALAVAHLVAVPRSWGTLGFYRQAYRFVVRDPERDRSLDGRLAVTLGAGLLALFAVAVYVTVAN